MKETKPAESTAQNTQEKDIQGTGEKLNNSASGEAKTVDKDKDPEDNPDSDQGKTASKPVLGAAQDEKSEEDTKDNKDEVEDDLDPTDKLETEEYLEMSPSEFQKLMYKTNQHCSEHGITGTAAFLYKIREGGFKIMKPKKPAKQEKEKHDGN